MCGIAGIINAAGIAPDDCKERLNSVVRVQNHRGPDANGVYVDSNVGFAHNRLSILDTSSAGNQPMWSRSRRSVIVYNGEIYNFRDLAVEYSIATQSRSDTEVLLELFERLGPSVFKKLNGMFAFAIHDRKANAVWVVRDRLGIKPLYFSRSGSSISFASEIKGLFELRNDLSRRMRIEALHEWLYFGNALGARTMFEGIEQLQPGHCLRIDLGSGGVDEEVFWCIDEAISEASYDSDMHCPEEAARRTLELLDSSVKRQLVSDVPVGIFLSGGIDSSSIACLASRHSGEPLATYSAAFDYDEERSELALAGEVARRCGSDHREIRVSGSDSAEVVRKMIVSHDLPFSDAANIPLFLMSESISATHKVVLQGDAGDEMFGGYQRHLTLLRFSRYRRIFRAIRGLGRLPVRNRLYLRMARMLSAMGAADDAKTMALLLTVEREENRPARVLGPLLRDRMLEFDPFSRYREIERRFEGLPLAEKMLLVDKAVILPDIFFQKVDRSTMAASVEVRVPFADNALLDHVLSLTPEVLMHGGVQKGLLRKAMQDVLPENVLIGRKRGFGVPFGYWVTGVFSEQFRDLTADLSRSHPELLNLTHIDSLWADHKARRADHGFMFWKILNLAMWIQEYDVNV